MRRIVRRPPRPNDQPGPTAGSAVSETAETPSRPHPDHDPGAADTSPDWAGAEILMPQPKRLISLRIDAEVLDWFQDGGKGYQTRMNAVLRAFMLARKGRQAP